MIADDLLPLFDNMPSVKVIVEYCEYAYAKPQAFYNGNIHIMTSHGSKLTNTLKHELTHAWVHWKGYPPDPRVGGHCEHFMRKAEEVGCDLKTVRIYLQRGYTFWG